MPIAIECRGLRKTYDGKVEAVRGLDLTFNTRAVAADASGNAYFTTGELYSGSPQIQGLHCVFKLDPDGIVTIVAGNSR